MRSSLHKTELDIRRTKSRDGGERTEGKPNNGLTKALNDIADKYLDAWDALESCCTLLALSLQG